MIQRFMLALSRMFPDRYADDGVRAPKCVCSSLTERYIVEFCPIGNGAIRWFVWDRENPAPNRIISSGQGPIQYMAIQLESFFLQSANAQTGLFVTNPREERQQQKEHV